VEVDKAYLLVYWDPRCRLAYTDVFIRTAFLEKVASTGYEVSLDGSGWIRPRLVSAPRRVICVKLGTGDRTVTIGIGRMESFCVSFVGANVYGPVYDSRTAVAILCVCITDVGIIPGVDAR
jgi:hypothetical protein